MAELAELAPSISFGIVWEVDNYFSWDGEGPDPREEGFSPYNVTVSATSISKGKVIEGFAYLGGCYEKPGEKDPDVHGYLPQKLEEAIDDILDLLRGSTKDQAEAAKAYLKKVMKLRHGNQMKRWPG